MSYFCCVVAVAADGVCLPRIRQPSSLESQNFCIHAVRRFCAEMRASHCPLFTKCLPHTYCSVVVDCILLREIQNPSLSSLNGWMEQADQNLTTPTKAGPLEIPLVARTCRHAIACCTKFGHGGPPPSPAAKFGGLLLPLSLLYWATKKLGPPRHKGRLAVQWPLMAVPLWRRPLAPEIIRCKAGAQAPATVVGDF